MAAWTVVKSAPGSSSTVRTTAVVSWQDAAGGSYGPVGIPNDTLIELPAQHLIAGSDARVGLDRGCDSLPLPVTQSIVVVIQY